MPKISELNDLQIVTDDVIWPVVESGITKKVNFLKIKDTILAPATTTSLGGVKVGQGLAVDLEGKIRVTYQYSLPLASTTTLGGVKVDGETIIIDPNGVITATGQAGQLSLDNLIDVNTANKISGQVLKWTGTDWQNLNEYQYTLPVADQDTLGGIKVGSNLTITEDGTLNAGINQELIGAFISTPESGLLEISSETIIISALPNINVTPTVQISAGEPGSSYIQLDGVNALSTSGSITLQVQDFTSGAGINMLSILPSWTSSLKPFVMTSLTTQQITDQIPNPIRGMIIFNDTTDKFQGYTGTSWVDLH